MLFCLIVQEVDEGDGVGPREGVSTKMNRTRSRLMLLLMRFALFESLHSIFKGTFQSQLKDTKTCFGTFSCCLFFAVGGGTSSARSRQVIVTGVAVV